MIGQYNTPVAAGGEFKIIARPQTTRINDLFLGQTLITGGMLEMTTGESDTVASGAITVANGANFVEDFGNAATGVQLTPLASSPAAGVSCVPLNGSPVPRQSRGAIMA